MTNEVLYRKWRPQLFSEIVGQESITRTLTQAVSQGKVAHAYLFCGPRGTGKTSTARILAKALNCYSLNPKNSPSEESNPGEPDNNCQFCTAANEGRSLDVIEMDAASNRGIEDIRNLRERVFGSGPAEGRAKVYILDEAHMLTDAANNALLKTLEEPAPWAYFILCTTEAHRIPPTIISRCQRFDLRRISSEDIFYRLGYICKNEEFQPEEGAMKTIARKSWGSLRDACNMLDQAVTSFGPNFTASQAQELLGISHDQQAVETIRHILSGDLPNGLRKINQVGKDRGDMRAFHQELVEYLQIILLLKSGVPAEFDLPVLNVEELDSIMLNSNWDHILITLKVFAAVKFRGDEIYSTLPTQLALIESIDSFKHSASPTPDATLPETSATMFQHTTHSLNQSDVSQLDPAKMSSPSSQNGPEGTHLTVTNYDNSALDPTIVVDSEESFSSSARGSLTSSQWDSLSKELRRFKGKRFWIGSLMMDCVKNTIEENVLTLTFKNKANLERFAEEMEYPPSQREFSRAIQLILGREYSLRLIALERNPEEINPKGHLIRSVLSFGGKIITESEANG